MVQYEILCISFFRRKLFKEVWSWFEPISDIWIGVREISMLAEINVPSCKCLSIYCCFKSKYIATPDGLFVTCAHPLDITVLTQFFQGYCV